MLDAPEPYIGGRRDVVFVLEFELTFFHSVVVGIGIGKCFQEYLPVWSFDDRVFDFSLLCQNKRLL